MLLEFGPGFFRLFALREASDDDHLPNLVSLPVIERHRGHLAREHRSILAAERTLTVPFCGGRVCKQGSEVRSEHGGGAGRSVQGGGARCT